MTRRREITATAETAIQAPPHVVFRSVSEPGRVPLWVSDLVESRPTEPEAQLRVGAQSIEVLKIRGRLVEIPAVVTCLEADRLIENLLETPEGPCRLRTVITASTAGSAVAQTMTASIEGARGMPILLLRILMSARLRSDLKRLQALVEND